MQRRLLNLLYEIFSGSERFCYEIVIVTEIHIVYIAFIHIFMRKNEIKE